MDQMFCMVESNPSYAGLLEYAQICRHLHLLGGVPHWVVQYLKAVKKTSVQGEPVSLDNIEKSFVNIWTKYVAKYADSLKTPQLVRLAAFAVSGKVVQPYCTFYGKLKWSRLRDSSLCLLIPRMSSRCGEDEVRVPYALLRHIGLQGTKLATEAERNFANALDDMSKLVDSTMFDLQLWRSWGTFGACFYAVRINALLALGHSTVELKDLLPGTLMSDETGAIAVKLVPSRVVRCEGTFGTPTPPVIPRKGNTSEPIEWTLGGYIVVSEDNGAGVDIFFALKEDKTDRLVVFVDQRRRPFRKCQPSHTKDYVEKMAICPDFLVETGAKLVRGIMNCVASLDLASFEVPSDCFLLTRKETEKFYGTLSYHPARSPVICINSASKTALKKAFEGDAGEVDQVVDEIMRKRTSGGCTPEELQAFTQAKRFKVRVDDMAEFSS